MLVHLECTCSCLGGRPTQAASYIGGHLGTISRGWVAAESAPAEGAVQQGALCSEAVCPLLRTLVRRRARRQRFINCGRGDVEADLRAAVVAGGGARGALRRMG